MTISPHCARCGRPFSMRLPDADGWNVNMTDGRITSWLCPDCQTPEDNAEAEVNLATTEYRRDAQGRVHGRPKAVK